MDALLKWISQLDFSVLIELTISLGSSILCITVHEVSHGLAAFWLGDDTAKRSGRLSLNPLKHMDVIGLALMAVVRFGWAKPVPVNPRKMKHPKLGMALTAFAGPLSNVLLALTALIVGVGIWALYVRSSNKAVWFCMYFLEYTAVLSSGLAVFNLFPIPPLDGSKILYLILPQRVYRFLLQYERYGMILLMLLLFLNVLDVPLLFLRDGLLELLQSAVNPLFDYVFRLS